MDDLKPTKKITSKLINLDQFAILDDYDYNDTYGNLVLNPFVNFMLYGELQLFVDSITAEAIQFSGIKFFYIERTLVNLDMLFGEDPTNEFKKAYQFAAYLDSYDGLLGQNTFFNKFGMTVNDEMTILINPTLFAKQCNNMYPKEGDLVIFEEDQLFWEITYVDKKNPFLQLGTASVVKIQLSKFIYSGENIDLTLQNTESKNTSYDLDLNELITLDNIDENNLNFANNLTGVIQLPEEELEKEQIDLAADSFIIDKSSINGSTPIVPNKKVWFGD